MTLTERHIAATARLAADYVASLLQPSAINLRDMSETGIIIETNKDMPDIEIRNTLNRIASWWGYSHGDCTIEITTLEAGFFEAAKRAVIKFK